MAQTGCSRPQSRSDLSRRRRPSKRVPIGPPIGSGRQLRVTQDHGLGPEDSPLGDRRGSDTTENSADGGT